MRPPDVTGRAMLSTSGPAEIIAAQSITSCVLRVEMTAKVPPHLITVHSVRVQCVVPAARFRIPHRHSRVVVAHEVLEGGFVNPVT